MADGAAVRKMSAPTPCRTTTAVLPRRSSLRDSSRPSTSGMPMAGSPRRVRVYGQIACTGTPGCGSPSTVAAAWIVLPLNGTFVDIPKATTPGCAASESSRRVMKRAAKPRPQRTSRATPCPASTWAGREARIHFGDTLEAQRQQSRAHEQDERQRYFDDQERVAQPLRRPARGCRPRRRAERAGRVAPAGCTTRWARRSRGREPATPPSRPRRPAVEGQAARQRQFAGAQRTKQPDAGRAAARPADRP